LQQEKHEKKPGAEQQTMVPFSPEEIACIVENFFAGSKSRARGFSVINWLVGVVVGGGCWVVFSFRPFRVPTQSQDKQQGRAQTHTNTRWHTHRLLCFVMAADLV